MSAAQSEAEEVGQALVAERTAHAATRRERDQLIAANDRLEDDLSEERAVADTARRQAADAEAKLARIHRTLAAAQRALADLPLDGAE